MALGKGLITMLCLLVGNAPTGQGDAPAIPVRLYRGGAAFAVKEDTGTAAEAEKVLEGYLRRRFESLGVKLTESDTVYTFEVHFTVLALDDGQYDVAFVSTVCPCDPASRRARRMRTKPFDWHLFHEYADLEVVSRKAAEGMFTEIQALETIRRTSR